jgi:hypothetical protein
MTEHDAAARLDAAVDEALAGTVEAVATGPIHKEALHAAGIPFPGHTEILADRTKAEKVCMMLTSDAITCSLVTVHVGYGEVPALLTRGRVLDTIELAEAARGAALLEALHTLTGEHLSEEPHPRTAAAAAVVRALVDAGFVHHGEAAEAIDALATRGIVEQALLHGAAAEAEELLALATAAGAAYAARPVRRAFRLLPRPRQRAAAAVAVPALMAVTDLAKMTGYLRGLLKGRRESGGNGE